MAWFRMPPVIMQAYDRYRTRYEAERTLGMYQAMLIGSSQTATRDFASEWLEELKKRIEGGAIIRGDRPESLDELSSVTGINVVIER
jgi:hypothetical protein